MTLKLALTYDFPPLAFSAVLVNYKSEQSHPPLQVNGHHCLAIVKIKIAEIHDVLNVSSMEYEFCLAITKSVALHLCCAKDYINPHISTT